VTSFLARAQIHIKAKYRRQYAAKRDVYYKMKSAVQRVMANPDAGSTVDRNPF
jgi:hypothetical protein